MFLQKFEILHVKYQTKDLNRLEYNKHGIDWTDIKTKLKVIKWNGTLSDEISNWKFKSL